jgi:hypothetical protein
MSVRCEKVRYTNCAMLCQLTGSDCKEKEVHQRLRQAKFGFPC